MPVIRHVDAFTARPLEGNPAAVVDGDGLDTATMQRIALNQKLSETVFLLPPETKEAHARLRIFTPGKELPFAGHPVVAAAHTLVTERRVRLTSGEPLRLETGAGLIPVAVGLEQPPVYTMRQAPPRFRECTLPADEAARCLGLPSSDILRAEYVSTGIEWLIVQIRLDRMPAVTPNMTALWGHDLAVFCVYADRDDVQVHVRAFAPEAGVFEDPVTGSANGCIGAFIAKHGLLPAKDGVIVYVAEQGLEMGQPGRARVRVECGADNAITVHVGGQAVTVLLGELLI
jgi:PhzF family phenazine biosynthesis protein